MTNTVTGGAPPISANGTGPNAGLQFDPLPDPAPDGPAPVGDVAIAVPGLLLIDVSWSMAEVLDPAQRALAAFQGKLRRAPSVAQSAWLGVTTFADTARTDLPLTRIADPATTVPMLQARGSGTNFHAAFTEALDRFRTDLAILKDGRDGGGSRKVFRPTIYFVTDGEHNTGGDYTAALAELRSRTWKPNIMAFGSGHADRTVIRDIATEGMAYFAEDGQTPDTMFEVILQIVLRSIVSNTATVANPVAMAPTPIDPKTDPATAGLALLDPVETID